MNQIIHCGCVLFIAIFATVFVFEVVIVAVKGWPWCNNWMSTTRAPQSFRDYFGVGGFGTLLICAPMVIGYFTLALLLNGEFKSVIMILAGIMTLYVVACCAQGIIEGVVLMVCLCCDTVYYLFCVIDDAIPTNSIWRSPIDLFIVGMTPAFAIIALVCCIFLPRTPVDVIDKSHFVSMERKVIEVDYLDRNDDMALLKIYYVDQLRNSKPFINWMTFDVSQEMGHKVSRKYREHAGDALPYSAPPKRYMITHRSGKLVSFYPVD